jgi:hypothetical protein
MATPELSRRSRQQMRRITASDLSGNISRTAMKRLVQERRMEQQFIWAFLVTISSTTLYLVWRMPWGQELVRHLH